MEFSFHDPPPQLASTVKAIWCARGTKQEFEGPEPIVPDGCVEIVFNLGERFINADTGEIQPRDLLAGQMTRPVIALPTGEVDLIGVRFKTGRAGAALRIPMWELKDQLIAASDVIRGLDRLTDDLRNQARSERLDHLGHALEVAFNNVDAGSLSAVDEALEIIDASRGSVAIETVARRVGITRRHLERQFREARRADRAHSLGAGSAAARPVDQRRGDRGRVRIQRPGPPDPRMPGACRTDAATLEDDRAIAGGFDARNRLSAFSA
jgi:AraC-like DNA-binding protein